MIIADGGHGHSATRIVSVAMVGAMTAGATVAAATIAGAMKGGRDINGHADGGRGTAGGRSIDDLGGRAGCLRGFLRDRMGQWQWE